MLGCGWSVIWRQDGTGEGARSGRWAARTANPHLRCTKSACRPFDSPSLTNAPSRPLSILTHVALGLNSFNTDAAVILQPGGNIGTNNEIGRGEARHASVE